jgi:hypothetical protein
MKNITIYLFIIISNLTLSSVNGQSIIFFPGKISNLSIITYDLDVNGGCLDSIINGTLIDIDNKIIKISSTPSFDFGVCPGISKNILGVIPSGIYQIMIYQNDNISELFSTETFVFSTELIVNQVSTPQSQHESPSENSIQSGIGVIRGWICDARQISISLDGGKIQLNAAYGTSRQDTFSVCGDSNNGYGLVFNWNLLSDGSHTMSIIADGTIISTVNFTITTIGKEFFTNLEKQIEINDFPISGESVTVEWSEPDQNFKITNHH